MLDLDDLRLVRAIGASRSLASAARLLDLTPPAVTIRLQRMEARLDIRLAMRQPKGIELTDEGQRLYQEAVEILERVDALPGNIAGDHGDGQVCGEDGDVLGEYVMSAANQEHGIVSRIGAPDTDIAKRFPIGTRLRILPNHACATGAQHPEYHALGDDGTVQTWPRFYGW